MWKQISVLVIISRTVFREVPGLLLLGALLPATYYIIQGEGTLLPATYYIIQGEGIVNCSNKSGDARL